MALAPNADVLWVADNEIGTYGSWIWWCRRSARPSEWNPSGRVRRYRRSLNALWGVAVVPAGVVIFNMAEDVVPLAQ
jgi:hypothetical protein